MMTMTILLLTASFAAAWDPMGDITHPERMRNVERDAGQAISDTPNSRRNIGREIAQIAEELDRIRLEAEAVTGAAAAVQQWLIVSRNAARSSGVSPMPPAIRQALGNFYDQQIYEMVAFKIGDSGALTLTNLAFRFGDADAVTLIDTVIFKNEAAASDPGLWVHELKHVQQFRDWGTRTFSIRYLSSWDSVENEAYTATDQFNTIQKSAAPQIQ
ncbi:DUF4157 domain-containing protein [Rhizobiaceae bacterium n13]|uniref:DUF4157 domain-containing protein n=1 Tax=Ferirhizobium litorale TaxID=2927786 RepID=A0AAE3U571_9HYPH|nr:DUF4157 domain-containing protein [Fererhizobium litorale]MDI7864133.1 DUF4157 domain-containing protein [Fererhizobium litorale]MDI7923744.1 DUF4157 domain-containing protein [Fererhizobium litorale]